MNKRILLALLCLIFLAQASHSQRYRIWDTPPHLPADSLRTILIAQDSIVDLFYEQDDHPRGVALEKNGSLFFMLSGFSYVWEWQGERFVNHYDNQFHGYNFNAYKFVHNDRIYSYGGTGFWLYHPFLIYFDEPKREWEIMPYTNAYPTVKGNNFSFTFTTPDALFVYFSDERPFRTTRTIQPIKNDNFYRLDLNTYTWTSLGAFRIDFSNLDAIYYIETKNYLDLFSNTGYCTLLHKPSLRLKEQIPFDFSPINRATRQAQQQHTYHIQRDTITVLDPQFTRLGQTNLHTVYQQAPAAAQSAYKDQPEWTTSYHWAFAILVILGLTTLLWWIYRRRPAYSTPDSFPYPALLPHKDDLISAQRLDQCLNIPPETSESARRNRRSQAIKEINTQYRDIMHVNRERSKQDARIYVYRITRPTT